MRAAWIVVVMLVLAVCIGRGEARAGASAPHQAVDTQPGKPPAAEQASPQAPTTATPTTSTAPPPSKAASVAEPPGAESPPAPAPLDLIALKDRLKGTKAIGVFTKIALKNQVDDLLDQFRKYYKGKAKITLKDLRRSYELLLMKVLSLVQDKDQTLASAIVASREAIWSLLANPKTFATLQT